MVWPELAREELDSIARESFPCTGGLLADDLPTHTVPTHLLRDLKPAPTMFLHLRLAVLFLTAIAPAQGRPPNIVLILADDIGVECLSLYGGTSYQTPNIDRLAAEGMRFTQCHSQPLCTPSRVKLMTGRSNVRNYVAFSVLDRGERTFAHVLGNAGYKTAVAGKWQLLGAEHYTGGQRSAGTRPEDAGFQRHSLWQVEKLGSRYWGPRILTDGQLTQHPVEVYGPDLYCQYLLDFMAEHKEEPFLAYFPMAIPHNPFQPTPRTGAGPDGGTRPANFTAMVAYMDELVGRIQKKVDELGIAEHTLILFTADNGTNRNIRSQMGDREVAGGKGKTVNRGTHVPLIARWPGTVPANTTCSDLIDFSDFLPTFCDLGDIDPPGNPTLDGRTFAPQLRGNEGEPRDWIHIWYHPRPVGQPQTVPVQFVRDARWKLYRSGEFFDLDTDPEEQRPLIAADGTAAAARDRLVEALASFPRAAQKHLQPGG